MMRLDMAWQSETLARTFLDNVRGGIPYAADQLDIMLRVIASNGLPVRSFADLGCGSGVVTQSVLSRFPSARGTLLDFSGPMLAAARDQLRDHAAQIEFVRADMASSEMWQAVRGPFDTIVSGFAIHHLPDARKRELYAEIYGNLKPSGMFVNIEHVASPSLRGEQNFDDLMIDWLDAFHARRGSGKTRDQVANEYIHRPDEAANILTPVETQCTWLREIGFEEVDCYFKAFELAVFGGRRPASV